MTQEQRVLLASAISAVVMVSYLQLTSRQTKQVVPPPADASQQPVQSNPDTSNERNIFSKLQQLQRNEDVITLESGKLILSIGKSSATVHRVTLKEFSNMTTHEPLDFGGTYPILAALVDDQPVSWQLKSHESSAASWEYLGADHVSRELSVVLDSNSPVFVVSVASSNNDSDSKKSRLGVVSSWSRSGGLNGRSNMLEIVMLTAKEQPWQRQYLKYFSGVKNRVDVPRGTSMVTLAERHFCQSIKLEESQAKSSVIPTGTSDVASVAVNVDIMTPQQTRVSRSFKVYVGPRDFFRLRDAGFEKAFHVGMLANIGLVMMVFLKGIAAVTHNYGVAVIALSLIVTITMAPFTLISFRSMKKMQELQPKLEQLKKKYAKDAQKLNKETFALFKEHRVSPISGCLPMLLQMPIFFAMWSAISHIIEIRGQSFLWIKDLSLPDRLAKLPLGIDLNMLPIVMAAAMFFQTKMSQSKMVSSGSDDMARVMSGPLMPVLFGVMFYNMPSCLVLYWLTNSLTTLALYRTARG